MSLLRNFTRTLGLGIAMLLSLAFPVWAADSCPQNQIVVSGTDVAFLSTTPTASIEFTKLGAELMPWAAGQPCAYGCYDLPKGTIVARGFNTLYGPGDTHVGVLDDYVVLGPAGPPLSFEIVIQLTATIDVEGSASAGLGVSGSPSQMIQLSATGFTVLALPVVVAPGVPFQVGAFAAAVGGHLEGVGLAEATIRFRGLPAQYTFTSCQAYDLPTPLVPTTWGGIKAQYR